MKLDLSRNEMLVIKEALNLYIRSEHDWLKTDWASEQSKDLAKQLIQAATDV